MPTGAIIGHSIVWEDSGGSVMGRVHGVDGEVMVRADITSITFKIFNAKTDAVVDTGTLTIADVIFDTLQTDNRWSLDSTGYNFRHDYGNDAFPDPAVYRYEAIFTATNGTKFPVAREITAKRLFTS